MTKHAQGPTITSSGAGGAHIGFFGRPRICMNTAGDGGKAGGAGGGGNNGGQGGAGGSDDTAGALTEAAKKEVTDMVNSAVNGAMTNHLGRFKKQFTDEMTKTFSETLGPISEQLKALAERPQPQPPGKGGQGQGQGNELPQEIRDAMLRNENRIKELEQQNKAERDAREQEKNTRLREEERNKLQTVLRDRGIPDPLVRAAVAQLHTEDKRVTRTDDGRIVFKFARGQGQAQYFDELDVDKGVDEWLKSDEGKAYVPARQANGSGGQPARPGGTQSPGDKKAQATQDLAKILLGGGVG